MVKAPRSHPLFTASRHNRRADPWYRRVLVAGGMLMLLAAAGCSTPNPYGVSVSRIQSAASSGQAAQSTAPLARSDALPKDEQAVIGVWRGTSLASCGNLRTAPNRCNAEQKISFTLVQKDSQLGGYYACAYGNMNCRHMNESGKIVRASVNGSRLSIRVQMPDGSSCRFTGMRSDASINGGYTCLQGATAVEQGTWRAEHQY